MAIKDYQTQYQKEDFMSFYGNCICGLPFTLVYEKIMATDIIIGPVDGTEYKSSEDFDEWIHWCMSVGMFPSIDYICGYEYKATVNNNIHCDTEMKLLMGGSVFIKDPLSIHYECTLTISPIDIK